MVVARVKTERCFVQAVHQVAAQSHRIEKIKEVSTKLEAGEKVDPQEFAKCLHLIEEAALLLDQKDRITVQRALHQPSENGRLVYIAKLLNQASAASTPSNLPIAVDA
jgi:Zn finger protein HypA/HybF involved in hydrogenase expression